MKASARPIKNQIRTGTRLPDIKPQSPDTSLDRVVLEGVPRLFPIELVAPVVGLSTSFIRRVLGPKKMLDGEDVRTLLDLDEYHETFVRRSQVLSFLLQEIVPRSPRTETVEMDERPQIYQGSVFELLERVPDKAVQCVVTSTPYWALRIYEDPSFVSWADGEYCPYGHEQTPEGFVRHTTEILFRMLRIMKSDGSVWWNVMDSYNTRTQIRGNAAEALRAMQGKDSRGWADYECRRYSAGHSFLKDGEQCMIPHQIAYRASRLGYYVKSIITWAKDSTTPEPQNSRVSRNLEYVLHLALSRTPKFSKDSYRDLPPSLGGRIPELERDRLTDVWNLPTSSGRGVHGAQFPIALPARCIGLSTSPGDLVLDPFVGSGTSAIASMRLGRAFIGFDVSSTYVTEARRRVSAEQPRLI